MSNQARLVERARIVLGCLEGEPNDQIAAKIHLQVATVALWRKRFLDGAIAALGDLPRPGKPPTYDKVELRAHTQASRVAATGRPVELGWRHTGDCAQGVGRYRLAGFTQGRHSTAANAFLVHQYRPGIFG